MIEIVTKVLQAFGKVHSVNLSTDAQINVGRGPKTYLSVPHSLSSSEVHHLEFYTPTMLNVFQFFQPITVSLTQGPVKILFTGPRIYASSPLSGQPLFEP